jgi:hypothetical protein
MAITAETRARVRRATSALSGRSRTLIDALYYRPCGSYADIARHTGIPVGSIGPTNAREMRWFAGRWPLCDDLRLVTESDNGLGVWRRPGCLAGCAGFRPG